MLVNKLLWKVKGSELHQENTLFVTANTKVNEVVLENHGATLHSQYAWQLPHQVMSERCRAGTKASSGEKHLEATIRNGSSNKGTRQE
jgi:hypothetical protein